MFEKEAEEYADEKCGTIETEEKKFCRMDWQKGAEFGYNKAKEEGKVVVEHFEAYGQCRDSRRIASLEAQIEKMKQLLEKWYNSYSDKTYTKSFYAELIKATEDFLWSDVCVK